MKIAALLATLALGAVASATTVDPAAQFMQFAQKFNKRYHNEEEWQHRFEIFKTNLDIVEKLNSEHGSAVYGVTKFMDLAPEEFKNTYLLRHELPVLPEEGLGNTAHPVHNAELIGSIPSSFDWRDKGAVTPVKNQGQCGSCWAFSTTEEIESQWILAGNTETILSEQQIVDCDKTDDGCGGGDTPTAYAYVISAGGLESEASYPYRARNERCQFDKSKVVASITGWKYITKSPQSNETLMLESLVTAGPFSICVDAASWQFYTSGIIQSRCGQSLDHCVQLTGYDQSGSVPYWIVRNSWGTDWGLSGYLYVEIGKNLCGIADEVTIAVV